MSREFPSDVLSWKQGNLDNKKPTFLFNAANAAETFSETIYYLCKHMYGIQLTLLEPPKA